MSLSLNEYTCRLYTLEINNSKITIIRKVLLAKKAQITTLYLQHLLRLVQDMRAQVLDNLDRNCADIIDIPGVVLIRIIRNTYKMGARSGPIIILIHKGNVKNDLFKGTAR